MLKRLWSSEGKSSIPDKKLSPHHLFEESNDPVAIYDHEFRLVMVNRSFSELCDLPVSQIVGRACYEVLYHRSADCAGCHLKQVFHSGKPLNWEENRVAKNGFPRNFMVYATPVKNRHGVTIFIIQQKHDITSQKLREERQKDSEEKYRTIVEMTKEGIFVLDPLAKVTFANRGLAKMLGYQLEEIQNASLFDFMDKDALVKARIERSPEGLVDVHEVSLRKKDGDSLTARISLTSLKGENGFRGSVGIVSDITYLKKVEASNRWAREFSKKIVNSITDPLIVIDPKTYQIAEANRSFLSRVGLNSVSVLEKTCYEVIRGFSSPCEFYGIHCPVRETALNNRSTLIERGYRDVSGRESLFQISTYPLLGNEGEVELVIRLAHDITYKRRIEKTLAARTRELEKANNKLKTLFEISKQVAEMGLLADLANFILETSLKIFPVTKPVFLILNSAGDGFLSLEASATNLVEPTHRFLKLLDQLELKQDFIAYLNHLDHPAIIDIEAQRASGPMRPALENYSSGFGLPVLVKNKCIGYFMICSHRSQTYDPDDCQFFKALFDQIGGHIRRLIVHEAEISKLRRQVSLRTSFGEIVGRSQVMQEVYNKIRLVAGSDVTVLITGENGTGKELVARAIHRMGNRKKGPFVVANCAAFAPSLLESELFGHEKGAFTGAVHQKKGRIERANGGTLFLDEIGNISLETQVLLLRFLQNHCFERVGGEESIQADVRVLAATNRDLQQEVQAGRFRSDLYYRLNVVAVHLPPLRERKEDIPLLTNHFLEKIDMAEGRKRSKFSAENMHLLIDYDWPGNVRQLENAVSHAIILAQNGVITKTHLPKFLTETATEPLSNSLAENERRIILQVLQDCKWNKHAAARHLQISRSTLYSKIRRHKLFEN